MVAIGISEFTFGFAFLYEQTHQNWENLTAVPVLPSLQQEADDAWDARLPLIGTDYYYQFKLSDHLSRSNAKYIQDGTYNGPYFRITLHRRDNNRQHNRLKLHAQNHPNTYYVAPEINHIDNFNAAFLARDLTEHSRIISVAECENVLDGDQHYLTFQEGDPGWIMHSEKRRHEKSISGKDVEGHFESTRNTWLEIDLSFATNVFETTTHEIRGLIDREERQVGEAQVALLDFDPRMHKRQEVLSRTSQLLSVFFGLTLVLVGQRRAR